MIKEECEKRVTDLLKASEHLAHGYSVAVLQRIGVAQIHARMALGYIDDSGLVGPEADTIKEVLNQVLAGLPEWAREPEAQAASIASRLDVAQENLIRAAPQFLCECGDKK